MAKFKVINLIENYRNQTQIDQNQSFPLFFATSPISFTTNLKTNSMKHKMWLVYGTILFANQLFGFTNSSYRTYDGPEAMAINANTEKIRVDTDRGEVRFVKFSDASHVSKSSFFEEFSEFFYQNEGVTYELQEERSDEFGFTHYSYQQMYSEIRVEGAEFILHEKEGRLIYANGSHFNLSHLASSSANISAEEAQQIALNSLLDKFGDAEDVSTESELLVTGRLPNENIRPCLSFKVTVSSQHTAYTVYVSSINGSVLSTTSDHQHAVAMTADTKYDNTQTIQGFLNAQNEYELKGDKTFSYSGQSYSVNYSTTDVAYLPYTNSATNWGTSEQAATSAHFAMEQFIDFMANDYNMFLHSFFDNIEVLIAWDPFNGPETFYNNSVDAVWLTYTDDVSLSDASISIDIVSHELMHRNIRYLSSLSYFNEYGAINESISDVFGTLTEFNSRGSSGNWLIGDDVYTGGIRDMSNPKSQNTVGEPQPDTYLGSLWHTTSADEGGVHINSGVGNYWFYLLSEGGSGTNSHGHSYNMNIGMGRQKAGDIVMYALENGLTSYSDYHQYALLTEMASNALFGNQSSESQMTSYAWSAVGIPFNFNAVPDLVDNHYLESAQTGACLHKRSSISVSREYANGKNILVSPDDEEFWIEKNPYLYTNAGNMNYSKSTLSFTSGLDYITSTVLADIDNDGDNDILASTAPTGLNNFYTISIFENDGLGGYSDVSSTYGIPLQNSSTKATKDFAVADYDRDGYLDIICIGRFTITLLHFNPSTGKYEDKTSNLISFTNKAFTTCSWGDMNNDGYPDLFIGNKAQSYFFENPGIGGTYFTQTNIQFPAWFTPQSSSWGDLDNDGKMDLVVGSNISILNDNSLLFVKNQYSGGSPIWNQISLSPQGGTFNVTALGDYDNDGDLDIFAGSEYKDGTLASADGYHLVLQNNGNLIFEPLFPTDLTLESINVSGAVFEDMNADGKIDIAVSSESYNDGSGSPQRCPGDVIYLNKVASTTDWITIQCEALASNKNAFGTKVEIDATINGTTAFLSRMITSKSGYRSQGSGELHFGLGGNDNINSIKVTWPSGIVQEGTYLPVNGKIVLKEGYPMVFDKTICSGTSTTLDPQLLSQGGQYFFYDEYLNFITSGVNYTTPALTKNTTYFVSIFDPTLPAAIGPETPKFPMTVYIEKGPDLVINSGQPTIPMSQSLEVDPTIASSFINFQWYKNNTAVPAAPGPLHVPTSIGLYHVEADWNDCPIAEARTSNEVFVVEDCALSPNYMNYNKMYVAGSTFHFTANTFLNDPSGYIFDGDFIIDPGVTVTFQGTSVLFMNCSGLRVSGGSSVIPGATLVVDNTTIEGCGLWNGITVYGDPTDGDRMSIPSHHGKVQTSNSSSIKHAKIAIHSHEGGIVDIDATTFKVNECHLALTDYSYDHDALIQNSTFGHIRNDNSDYTLMCPQYVSPTFNNSSIKKMVYCSNVSEVQIVDCQFSGNSIFGLDDPSRFGVETNNSDQIVIHNCNLEGQFTHAMHLENSAYCQINDSYVSGDMSYGVHGETLDNFYAYGTLFEGGGTTAPMENGIYLKSSETTTLYHCDFKELDFSGTEMHEPIGIGVQIYNSGINMQEDNIYQNTFEDLKVGLVIAPEEYPFTPTSGGTPVNTSTDLVNVKFWCNEFWRNQIGVSGSGAIVDQGDPTMDAHNKFYDHSIGTYADANIDWDIFWDDNASISPKYYYENPVNLPGYEAPNSYSGLQKQTHYFNQSVKVSNAMWINANQNDHLQCGPSWKKGLGASIPEDKSEITVYPNPTNDILFVKGLNTGVGNGILLNALGQEVSRPSLNNLASGYNVSHLPAGLYTLLITQNQGIESVEFIVQR